ncbi:MAG: hypothetical protein SPM09_09550 [Fibrobacter sp.]|uniref:glycosyltransferase family 52 n=1 Tax=Fibrobacter sp. TaxID=35828 RepID=UPI002A915206|nr:glycosyltransferase family 52 [Fibrobacter sp.]MDY6264639.1 hypothetical protein [Fibrobacter sp.]
MKKHFNRFCHIGSIYSLLLYIAYSTDEQLRDTFYIFDWMIPNEFAQKFKNSYHFHRHSFIPRMFSWIDLFIQKKLFCPCIDKESELFANDHLWSSSAVIDNHSYTLLEDSAGICSNYWCGNLRHKYESYRKSKSYKIRNFLFGSVEGFPHANNEICTDLLLTTDDFPDYISKKTIHRIKWFGLWNTFSKWKQEYIKNVYDISTEDLDFIKTKKIVLFTQPLYPDLISAKEHERIYQAIIEKYPIEKMLIKVHPRDTFLYEKINEKLTIYRKTLPSQVFDMFGIKFSTAVTVFSSAAKNFEYPITIDWYGTECSDELFKKVGRAIPPNNACIKTLL